MGSQHSTAQVHLSACHDVSHNDSEVPNQRIQRSGTAEATRKSNDMQRGGSPSPEEAASPWSLADLIDFEITLDQRDSIDFEDERKRYPLLTGAALRDQSPDRSTAFRRWLRARQAHQRTAAGDHFERLLRLGTVLAVAAGVLTGFSVCAGLVAVDGMGHPINALRFLMFTSGLQVLMLGLALCLGLAVALGWKSHHLSAAGRAALLVADTLLRRAPGEQRQDIRAAVYRVLDRSDRLQPLIARELLRLTQAFAITFNMAILAAMLLWYLPFSDLVFGWESTYQSGAEWVAHVVHVVAWPWNWVSDSLVPSQLQIEASRYVRGQAAGSIDPASAHAWWPFLLCAVLVWGLLPRLLLATFVRYSIKRRLQTLSFDDPASLALWRRLEGPLVVAEGGNMALPTDGATYQRPPPRVARALIIKSDACSLADGEVGTVVDQVLHWGTSSIITTNIDDDQFGPELQKVLRSGPDAVAVVTSAMQNPIVAIASFLNALRTSTGKGSEIVVVLVGASGELMDERLKIWRRFATIHQLPVGIECGP